MADREAVEVVGPDGSPVTIELLDTDVRGRPWQGVGYRAAIARLGRRRVEGYVHWLAGAWRFTALTSPRRRGKRGKRR